MTDLVNRVRNLHVPLYCREFCDHLTTSSSRTMELDKQLHSRSIHIYNRLISQWKSNWLQKHQTSLHSLMAVENYESLTGILECKTNKDENTDSCKKNLICYLSCGLIILVISGWGRALSFTNLIFWYSAWLLFL